MPDWLTGSWPWFVSGPLLGLMVPLLLFLGNKQFGVSSSLRHICAAALPLNADYFRYDWKSKSWNLALIAGVVAGAVLASTLLNGNTMPEVSERAGAMFAGWGLTPSSRLQPSEIFAIENLGNIRNLVLLVSGGFLIGFGTRYANGCTSGHGIMGLSLLNLGSFVAVLGFFIGGIPVSRFLVPLLLSWR